MCTKILIVEDNKNVRRALHNWLRLSFTDCLVIEATTGEEAIELVSEQLPHVVIMDIELPEMNGITATEKIKSVLPSVPVIILTMHQDEIYRLNARTAGAIAYVTKNEISTELMPALEMALSKKEDIFGSHNRFC